jgi:rubrerythrin
VLERKIEMPANINLDSEKGLNARLGQCVRCGEDNGEVILLGSNDMMYQCLCGHKTIGRHREWNCPDCGDVWRNLKPLGRVPEGIKIPSGLCDPCDREVKLHNETVRSGGIFWRCVDCGTSGSIRHTAQLSQVVRENMNIPAPEPVGIEFEEEDCPACGPDSDRHREYNEKRIALSLQEVPND